MMQALMVLTIGLQIGWLYAIALYVLHTSSLVIISLANVSWIGRAPPLISIVVFKILLSRKFDQSFAWSVFSTSFFLCRRLADRNSTSRFIPSPDEMAETHLHRADARKHRLEKRFGHPSMGEALFTPMLHKGVQHLLPSMYVLLFQCISCSMRTLD